MIETFSYDAEQLMIALLNILTNKTQHLLMKVTIKEGEPVPSDLEGRDIPDGEYYRIMASNLSAIYFTYEGIKDLYEKMRSRQEYLNRLKLWAACPVRVSLERDIDELCLWYHTADILYNSDDLSEYCASAPPDEEETCSLYYYEPDEGDEEYYAELYDEEGDEDEE